MRRTSKSAKLATADGGCPYHGSGEVGWQDAYRERLGHSSVTITLDTYSHAIPGLQRDAAERVAALIPGLGGQPPRSGLSQGQPALPLE